jgi:hypothetical protein
VLSLVALAAVFMVLEDGPAEHALMEALQNKDGSITNVVPAQGPYRGNTVVSINGVQLSSGGLNDIASVTLKGVPVRKIIKAEPNKLVVRTGSLEGSERPAGDGDVVVVSHAKGRAVGKHMYEYKKAALVFEVLPDNGAHVGGTRITIQGKNLCSTEGDKVAVKVCEHPAKKVRCMGHKVLAETSAFDSNHAERDSSGDACDVLVESKVHGVTTATRAFTYRPAPVITHVTPREGRFEGGNEVRVFGSDLTSGKGRLSEAVTVMVGGLPAEVMDYTPSNLRLKIPRGLKKPGFVDIKVTSKRHGVSTASGMYRVHPKPVIRKLSSYSGRATGGEHLTLLGSGMGRGDIESIRIGDHRAEVLWADRRGRKVKVLTPPFEDEDEGQSLDVVVHSHSRGHARIKGFKIHSRGAIHKISPNVGPAAGGTLVTLSGKQLGGDTQDLRLVRLGGVPATVVSSSPSQVVVRTAKASPGVDGTAKVYSRKHGVTASPRALRFTYAKTPQITAVRPAMADPQGGDLVVLMGERLCNAGCDDLEHVQIGNALITKFTSKSPTRLVFRVPSADMAGGAGTKTVTVRSKQHGDAEAPEGFLYTDGGSAGKVWPADGPLTGSHTVVIEGPDLGTAEEYRVMLAGVEAKVLSASSRKIEVQAGNAHEYANANHLQTGEGLRGNVIIETMLNGKASGMDSQILFRYNPSCRIDHVKTTPGPADGDSTLIISGQNLGMGDERLFIDGKPVESGFTVRRRQDSNIHELAVRSSTAEPKSLAIKSARTGDCSWKRE